MQRVTALSYLEMMWRLDHFTPAGPLTGAY